MLYFSEREYGERRRDNDEISDVAWNGVQVLIRGRIEDGSFGVDYPTTCPDGGRIGTDGSALWCAMRAEMLDFHQYLTLQDQEPWVYSTFKPPILLILDIIEFCWRHISKPRNVGSYHNYWGGHYHLDFDVVAGREKFCGEINDIFRRNNIAYEFKGNGSIERLVPPVLRESLPTHFSTGDSELNRMLETARRKFFDKNEATRCEALKDLWDAWERLKTLGTGPNKKAQATDLLDATAGSSSSLFRKTLEKEARELTEIGNSLLIRHSEKEKEPVADNKHVDYLFHRLFALIQLILLTNHMV